VIEEVKNIMRFWLNKGISGFRCDVINIISKSSLADSRRLVRGIEHYVSQPGAHEILQTLRRDVLSRYDCFTVGETVFVTPEAARDFCDESRGELDMIFSFAHMETDQFFVKWFPRKFHAGRFGRVLAEWQEALEWNANYLENHDQPRSVSRFGDDKAYWAESAKMLATMLLSLRGTPFIYQGQEIGRTNFDFASMEQVKDIESRNIWRTAQQLHIPKSCRWRMIQTKSRDNARTPMQWDGNANGGFTTGTPWLGVNRNHTRINLEAQKADPNSVRSYYKRMISLRAGSDVLKCGAFRLISARKNRFVFDREYEGRAYRVLLNFSSRPQKAPAMGTVLISNYNRETYDGLLQPWEAVIVDMGVKA
jgi:oligo-1,6-glucosidase